MIVSALGAMVMAESNDLILVFLGLEIMSIALYVLAAMNPRGRVGRGGAQVLRSRPSLLRYSSTGWPLSTARPGHQPRPDR